MMELNTPKQIPVPSVSFKEILDDVDTIQKINNLTKQSLASISNDTILQNFQKIDDIVSNLQNLLKQKEDTQINTSSKPHPAFTDVSLLDVLNHALPRKLSSKVTIHLPEKDITMKGLHYRLIVLFSN